MNYKVESLSDYIDSSKEEAFRKITKEIYLLTKHLNDSYPKYKEWFYNKQVKDTLLGKRNIIFVKDNENKIIGISSLKKYNEEKKICTLFILEEYRNKKITTILLEESLKYLETTKPLITISEDKIPMFQSIINKYNWQLIEIAEAIYISNKREYCFNGRLNK